MSPLAVVLFFAVFVYFVRPEPGIGTVVLLLLLTQLRLNYIEDMLRRRQ